MRGLVGIDGGGRGGGVVQRHGGGFRVSLQFGNDGSGRGGRVWRGVGNDVCDIDAVACGSGEQFGFGHRVETGNFAAQCLFDGSASGVG